MSRFGEPLGRWRSLAAEQAGFSLIELLIAMPMGVVISMVAFNMLIFAQSNVTQTNEQIRMDQAARTAFTNVMLGLHSGCINTVVRPIQAGSEENKLIYINARDEAAKTNSSTGEEAFIKPVEHELYVEESTHKLIEKAYPEASENSNSEYTFSTTATKKVLAEHVVKSEPKKNETLPYFRYYRYWESSEAGYEAGRINPTAISEKPLSAATAQKVAKVTVAFAVTDRLKHYNEHAVKPLELEDSAVYRLSPLSTTESAAATPCT